MLNGQLPLSIEISDALVAIKRRNSADGAENFVLSFQDVSDAHVHKAVKLLIMLAFIMQLYNVQLQLQLQSFNLNQNND